VEGTLAELRAHTGLADDLLRVVVKEPARAGLADDVRELLPNAIDIRIAAAVATDEPEPTRAGLTPHELFAAYLAGQGVDDERVVRLFTRLYDEATGSGA
jgi:exonuclease SbcD